MKFDSPSIDEYGTLRFMFVNELGVMYLFERGNNSRFLFVTVKDENGSAEQKIVIDLMKTENENIVEMYNDFIKEKTDEQ